MAKTTAPTFQMIPASKITKATNDRKCFDEEALKDLAWSIKTNGLAQPITVRVMGDAFELVAGERRLRAMTEILGNDEIPCIVQVYDDDKAVAIMLAENTSRVDLNPMEEAEAYQARLDKGWTVEHLADTAGVSKDVVRKRVALLGLIDEIKQLVRFGHLGLGHADAMTALDHNRQISALRILQQSAGGMPIATFREVCNALLAEQSQECLFDLALDLAQEALEGAGRWIGGSSAEVNVPTADDLPALVVKRERGMTAAYAIEAYIATLQAQGLDREAAVIGTLYSGLVKSSLMKPRKRLTPKPAPFTT